MNKHAFNTKCKCDRCLKEANRRAMQSANDPRRNIKRERRPVWGTQEWAETRGDDLGESPDF